MEVLRDNGIDYNYSSNYDLELLFETSPALVCIVGFDGFFKRINPAVSSLLGYSNEDLYTTPIHEFIYKEDRLVTLEALKQLKEGHPVLNFENRFITASGEIIWLSWTSSSINTDKIIYSVGKNISDKKKTDEERNKLLTNLTRINNDLRHITYTASHDLRAPVNNLLSIFSLLDVTQITDMETLEFLDILQSASENLKDTLNNYVDVLSHNNDLNVHEEEIDLNECLNSVLKSVKSLIHNSKATFEINFSHLKEIRFNREYLESIFLNLITNSIKYAKIGQAPEISIASQKVDGINQIILTDNGMGFDMDKVKNKIFGLHQKFNNHKDSKGIGLYLVHHHLTSLGGNIEVESKVNQGARFTMSFKD